jgi:hypothetical protein
MTTKPPHWVRVMAYYGTTGLWDRDDAPLNPSRLPISPKLRERLARWCVRCQSSFEREIGLDAFAAEWHAIGPPSNHETEIPLNRPGFAGGYLV